MKKLPLVVSDFLATGMIAIAMIVIVKTIVLSTPAPAGLKKVVAFV